MKALIDLIKILAIVIWTCSCSPKLRTGYQTIKEVRGNNTVTFEGVEGDWHIETKDSLKSGQRIYVQRTFKKDLATIW